MYMADITDLPFNDTYSDASFSVKGTMQYSQSCSASSISRKQTGIANVDALSQQVLLRNYLCAGEHSACVTRHVCECLNVCRYGQRYLQTIKEAISDSECSAKCDIQHIRD